MSRDRSNSAEGLPDIDEALESLSEEVRGKNDRIIEEREEILERSRSRQKNLVEEHLQEMEELHRRHEELIEEFGEEYGQLVNEQVNQLEGLEAERRGIVQEYAETMDEARNAYLDLMDDYIDRLDELSGHKIRGAVMDGIAGAVLTGVGFLSAEGYDPTTGIIDFYTSAPMAYTESPGLILTTLGLPALGLYSLKEAYDRSNEYSEVEGELDDLKEKRLEDRMEELGEDGYR